MVQIDLEALRILIIFIITIALHEYGHWLAFKYYKFNPVLKFKIIGISLGENIWFNMTAFQANVVLSMGIPLGMLPMVLFQVPPFFPILYIFISMSDLLNIFEIMSYKKEDLHKTLLFIMKKQIKKWEIENGR